MSVEGGPPPVTGTFTAPDRPPVEFAPRAEPRTPREWIRENLFSSWFNGILTVVGGILVLYYGYQLFRWAFVDADWGVVRGNFASYMLARFPREEAWRVFVGLYLVVLLGGLSYGVAGKRIAWTPRRVALAVGIAIAALGGFAYVLEGLRIWLLTLAVPALVALGIAIGRNAGRRAMRFVVIAWLVVYPIVVLVLVGFGGPSPSKWGGLLLNVMVGSIGIVASFPIGIILALGRRSSFPAVRTVCVGFIELIRGVPLITLLFAGQYFLPLLLPPDMKIPTIIRLTIMFTIFSSVYVAEIVRGGLQGVDRGQYEAGRAVGLSTTRLTALVILPQALRNTIPALISHFISVWKDTSLLSIVAGFDDLLAAARQAAAGLEYIGDKKEALIGAWVIFWGVAITLGRWSQRLEKRVGVGER